METKERATFKVYPFTMKRYEQFKKDGILFRIIDDHSCREWQVVATGNNIVTLRHDHTCTASFYFNGKGVDSSALKMYIFTGIAEDVHRGDLVIQEYANGFCFYGIFNGFHIGKEMGKGWIHKWNLDSHGGQFSLCQTMDEAPDDKNHHSDYIIRRATDDELNFFYEKMEENGYICVEGFSRIVEIPTIGKPYFAVEMHNGEVEVVERPAPTCNADRPYGHYMCFSSKGRAEHFAEMLDKIIKTGKDY